MPEVFVVVFLGVLADVGDDCCLAFLGGPVAGLEALAGRKEERLSLKIFKGSY